MNHILQRAFIVFLLTLPFVTHSQVQQGKVLLMNGSIIENTLWEEKDGMIYIYDQKKNLFGKEKTRAIELNKSEIFSLANGSKEQVLYYQDTMLGDYYTPEEMRVYLAGSGDSRKNFKARHVAAIGFTVMQCCRLFSWRWTHDLNRTAYHLCRLTICGKNKDS